MYWILSHPQGDCYARDGDLIPAFSYASGYQSMGDETPKNISRIVCVILVIEIAMNLWRIFLIPINTCFQNKKGIGKKLNIFTEYLQVVRILNLGLLSYYVFSFEGEVCFCSGRQHFYEYCSFMGNKDQEVTYQCKKVKQERPSGPDAVD